MNKWLHQHPAYVESYMAFNTALSQAPYVKAITQALLPWQRECFGADGPVYSLDALATRIIGYWSPFKGPDIIHVPEMRKTLRSDPRLFEKLRDYTEFKEAADALFDCAFATAHGLELPEKTEYQILDEIGHLNEAHVGSPQQMWAWLKETALQATLPSPKAIFVDKEALKQQPSAYRVARARFMNEMLGDVNPYALDDTPDSPTIKVHGINFRKVKAVDQFSAEEAVDLPEDIRRHWTQPKLADSLFRRYAKQTADALTEYNMHADPSKQLTFLEVMGAVNEHRRAMNETAPQFWLSHSREIAERVNEQMWKTDPSAPSRVPTQIDSEIVSQWLDNYPHLVCAADLMIQWREQYMQLFDAVYAVADRPMEMRGIIAEQAQAFCEKTALSYDSVYQEVASAAQIALHSIHKVKTHPQGKVGSSLAG